MKTLRWVRSYALKALATFKTTFIFALMILLLFIPVAVPIHARQGNAPPIPGGQNLKFTHLAAKDGLPNFQVLSILQDHQGFMWFGTTGGLYRYDGYEFKAYQHDMQDQRSLVNDYVRALYEDRAGTLWIGTNSGLDRHDPETDTFVHYQHDPKNNSSLPNDLISVIYEDQAARLWIGTRVGLSRFDQETGKFFTYKNNPDDPNSLSGGIVFDIAEDKEKSVLWLGTLAGGVNVLDQSTGIFTNYRNDPNNPASLSSNTIYDVYKDREGTWWVGTSNGLDRWDPVTKKFAHYQHDSQNPNSVADNLVQKVYEDSAGRFWVSTRSGLDLFDRQSGTFFHVRNDPDVPDSFSENSVWYIYEDNTGAMWFSTVTGGVNRLAGEPEKFMTYRNDPKNPNSLSADQVRVAYVDRAGTLWMGTTRGLDHFDGKTVTHFLTDPDDPTSLGLDMVAAITEDSRGNLWIGADVGGLNRFDGKGFTRYLPDPKNPDSLGGNGATITFLYPDERGGLWIGLGSWGVDYFDGKTFTHYRPNATKPDSAPTHFAFPPAKDQEGALWLASDTRGLVRFDPATKTFSSYLIDPEHPESEINQTIITAYIDRNEALWIGGVAGLIRFDLASHRFTQRYTKKDGLPAEIIEGILGDDQGKLWISTSAGLSKFDPATGVFRNYDVADGLPSNQFIDHASLKGPDGRMYFGSLKGLVAFYPDRLKDNPYVPPIVLTGFELFNAPVAIGKESPLQKAIQVADQVTLRYDQSVFTLQFAALGYSSPEKNQYAYKMEGFDGDWRYTDAKRRSATYTNLDPGEYVFRVRGSNNDGVWNETGASINIIITPPWWETWWFRGAAVAALIILAYSGYRLRVRGIKQINQELTRQVADRTAQLEAANKELEAFAYSVSHDLRVPLRHIEGFLELLQQRIRTTLDEQSQHYVATISDAARRMDLLIDDLLSFSRMGRYELSRQPVDLKDLVQEVIRDFEPETQGRDIHWRIADLPVVIGDRALLRIVLVNLISNALKFTRSCEPVEIEIGCVPGEATEIVVFVRDNGVGFDMNYADKLFGVFQRLHRAEEFEGTGIGLANVRQIIQRHGGRTWATGEVDRGATFYFSLPKSNQQGT